jgi:hypothetical protein
MKMEEKFSEFIFAQRCKDASAIQIADIACVVWRDISSALSPVLGQRGVAALFKRSLHLQHLHYPVLKTIHSPKILSSEFPSLHAILGRETTTNAILINNALLNTFYELLTRLIGISLTHQLLHSLLAPSSNGDPVQDTLS